MAGLSEFALDRWAADGAFVTFITGEQERIASEDDAIRLLGPEHCREYIDAVREARLTPEERAARKAEWDAYDAECDAWRAAMKAENERCTERCTEVDNLGLAFAYVTLAAAMGDEDAAYDMRDAIECGAPRGDD